MKFVCDRCQTRYSIADEKVRQRILRIRCKTCSNVITVQAGEMVPDAQDSSKGPEPGARASSASAPGSSSSPSRLSSGRPEWFVAVDGVEQGPLSCTDTAKTIVSLKTGQSVHVWKEGMDGWKLPQDVAIIARELGELGGAPAGPSSHAPVEPTRANPSSVPRPTPAPADSAPKVGGALGPGPKPPPKTGFGSGRKLPQLGPGSKLSARIPESRPKVGPPPIPGVAPKAAPPPIPGVAPKAAPPPIPGVGPKVAPPPIPGSGHQAPPPIPESGHKAAPPVLGDVPTPAGGFGPERARHPVAGSEPSLGRPGSGPKLPPPPSGSGPKPPYPVFPDSVAETPLPSLSAGAPHPGPRPVPVSVVPSSRRGPALPGLTPLSVTHPPPASALETEFDKAPATKPDRRPSVARGVVAPGTHVQGAAQPTLPGRRLTEDDFDQGQKTPPPSQRLPPIAEPGRDGHDGKNSPLLPPASAHPPALPQPFDWSGEGLAAAADMNPAPPLAPPAGSLFSDVAALPATLFPAAHAEVGLSRLTGLAALGHRHRHLKYVITAGIVVVLVILVILVSWRGESGKATRLAAERAARVPETPSLNEAETPPQDDRTGGPENRPQARAAARVTSKRSPAVRSANPSDRAATVRPDPFEGPSASSRSHERPVPVETAGQPRRPPGGEGRVVSQAQISEVVRNRENQAGLKTCYERALKQDGRFRTGRLDITVSVGESGVVQQVHVHGPSDFLLIDGCIKNAIRHWRFPPSAEEYATSFPLILQGG